MASLAKINGARGTTWRIDFYLGDDPKRKHIRLGRMNRRQAISIKTNIERLIEAKATGIAPDPDISRWVAERDDAFHAKLAHYELVVPRVKIVVPTLAQFIDSYIASRTGTHSYLVSANATQPCGFL